MNPKIPRAKARKRAKMIILGSVAVLLAVAGSWVVAASLSGQQEAGTALEAESETQEEGPAGDADEEVPGSDEQTLEPGEASEVPPTDDSGSHQEKEKTDDGSERETEVEEPSDPQELDEEDDTTEQPEEPEPTKEETQERDGASHDDGEEEKSLSLL